MKKNKPGITHRTWADASKSLKGHRQVTDEWKQIRDTKVPLKSGTDYEIGWIKFWEKELRGLSEASPDLLRALHNIVQGNFEQATERQLKDLKSLGFLNKSRVPLRIVTVVMEAAYRETPDGPCIVDPLEAKSPESVVLVEKFDDLSKRAKTEGTRELLRKIEKIDREEGMGRAR